MLTHLPTAQAAIASTSVAEAPRSATPSSVTSSSDTSSSAIPNSGSPSQQDQLAAGLAEQWWTPLLFLALGIGLAFTPCVLPMYPILSGIVLGNGQVSHRRAFGLAFAYVQGMALTYTLLGLVVASAGLQFQAAMQHPYILIGLSGLFVVLALSMFGTYTLQLPSRVQTWLHSLSHQQQGGRWGGVFAMGAISGLVCSPCTTAPLSGALIYVAQSGDLLTGAVALYALALGMGIPLIAAAMFGNKLLPQAGAWMTHVKTGFGFVLLAVPLFLLERILPAQIMPLLWGSLGFVAFGWLYYVKMTLDKAHQQKTGQHFTRLDQKAPLRTWHSTALGVVAFLGMFASAVPIYHQLSGNGADASAVSVTFTRIENIDDLELALENARAEGKPVMLDFYADWCVACKEFDEYTFHDPDVAAQLGQFVLLQADVTGNTPTDFELLQSMDVLGLPTVDFWDAKGNRLEHARLTGFTKAAPFLAHLDNHQLMHNNDEAEPAAESKP
ncbi:cytochrome c-type biogenesis protein DsbD protein-disulfide reductase [Photobacterium aphoticum]|uniref:Cytochrome c-type biogenesis protein DsbD protein-disulfide reductase n=1 Tax=Photobacterium aphoticum TaxID=754436 RepID=A0A090QZU9_9GAMM|nr:cytochrome c-type biogenesis protein DsbD protein-disulfide reductase [Photobacterium aphoticum]